MEGAYFLIPPFQNGAPCNGELRVMKKVRKEDGVGAFLGNVSPQLLGINGAGTVD